MTHYPHLEREAQDIARAKANALVRIDLTRLALVGSVPKLAPLRDVATDLQADYLLGMVSLQTLHTAQVALIEATRAHAAACPDFCGKVAELQDLEDLITKWED